MKKNNFVEGTVIATAVIVIVKLLGLLYVIPFYQIVGDQGGDLYSYAYNIYMIFLSISSAGLPDAIAKIISEYNALEMEDAKKRAYMIGKKIISIISITSFLILFVFAEEIGMFIIGNLKGGNTAEDVAFVIRCLSPAVLLIPFLSITKGFLQGHKYISASSMSQLIEQIVRIFVILAGSFLVYKVFRGTLSLAVGIAVSGAFFGGLAAYLYLKRVINKNNLLKESRTKDNISNRDITKKIIIYAIPFVIISVINSLYNETDQILVLRLLEYLNFDAKEVENIAAAIATWSPKICIIINAMAMGMTMSLVPTIVSSFAKKDHKDVERQINKTLSMIVFVSLPLSIGISVLSNSIWTLFYTPSEIGGNILRLMAFSALLGNLVMIVSTLCQSVNKYHAVYIVAILGLVLNAGLDIPIMILYNKIGLPTYLGSITATMIGYSISILIGLLILRKENKYSYTNAFKNILKSLIPGLSMLFVLVLVNHFLPFDAFSKKTAVFNIIIDVIIGAPIYIGLSLKLGLIDEILGRTMFNKLIRKITFGKINLKDA